MKRRQFMLSLAGSAALVGWAGWKTVSGSGKPWTSGLSRLSRSSWALGTQVKLTVFHGDETGAKVALEEAFAELERVESVMSLYRSDSQICQLNRTGQLESPHPYLVEVLKTAERVSAETSGAFDITVQPLYKLYAEHNERGIRPGDDDIAAVLKRVGWKRVKLGDEFVSLEGEETEITLNGIAQGFAADAVGKVLQKHGIQHALIDTGEVNAVGGHVEHDNWNIGIKHPREEGSLLALAQLNGRCLATSGDYETRFGSGYEFHHLLDPQTGRSPQELSSVSVVAPTALEADALSTALFLTGMDRGMQLIESIPEADALFVSKTGKVVKTSGFPIHS
ncbi:FAD:protein FMN transferase [Puniceicoccales bacterium CK1056]|uniref:FAD:protein FMN transferase n=1 Tax=Oceanipulchritudo coccoides TaxID=2706888 RepID=A0A6B2M158_9BACT|nr:FAD:protein FMN transferase [Oceanipulchritudo coccoides]NDV62142.1 FAD:protein FMN transferase [Oceanipulchritudo coccoides]